MDSLEIKSDSKNKPHTDLISKDLEEVNTTGTSTLKCLSQNSKLPKITPNTKDALMTTDSIGSLDNLYSNSVTQMKKKTLINSK